MRAEVTRHKGHRPIPWISQLPIGLFIDVTEYFWLKFDFHLGRHLSVIERDEPIIHSLERCHWQILNVSGTRKRPIDLRMMAEKGISGRSTASYRLYF